VHTIVCASVRVWGGGREEKGGEGQSERAHARGERASEQANDKERETHTLGWIIRVPWHIICVP